MKKILFLVVLTGVGFLAKAQTNPFPSLDSLGKFINRYIRNSPVESFQNLRINTALTGVTRFLRDSYGGQVLSFTKINDSTIRLITLDSDTMDITGIGSGGSANLDSLRTDTTITVLNDVGTDALLAAADTVRAGVMRASDKKKLDRVEILNSPVELRALPTSSTNVIYRIIQNKIIRDFYYDPSDASTADDSVMTIVGTGGARYKQYVEDYVNVKWFGAVGDGVADDWYPIQKAVNWVANNSTKATTVLIPSGNYRITFPIMIYRWNGTNYQQVTVNIRGQSAFWPTSGAGTIITTAFKDKFGIGIELGKGCKVENIKIIGGFTYPAFATNFDFYNKTLSEFKDPTCRDTTYSPFSGIVIDPFTLSAATIPSDGGYPGMTDWYRGTGGTGGSTGTVIKEVMITGFVVGICSSPNGVTRNAELSIMEKVQFANTKLCVSGGHEQEKINIVRDAASWGVCHTFFATGVYGTGAPGNWLLQNLNLAGFNNTFIFNQQTGYFPTNVDNLFTESLGKFGTITTQLKSTVTNSNIEFATPDISGGITDWQLDVSNVLFQGCVIRYYAQPYPVNIKAGTNTTFENCAFNAIPFAGNYPNNNNAAVTFKNCYNISEGYSFGWQGNVGSSTSNSYLQNVIGSYKMHDRQQSETGLDQGFEVDSKQANLIIATSGTKAITIAGASRAFTFTVSASDLWRYELNRLLAWRNGVSYQPAGLITGINTGTNEITVSRAAVGLVDGTYQFATVFPLSFAASFMGDLTNGNDTIKNVRADWGNIAAIVNKWIKVDYTGASGEVHGEYVRALAWNSTTRQLKVSKASTVTQTGVYFGNAARKYLKVKYKGYATANYQRSIYAKGQQVVLPDFQSVYTEPVEYLVVKTGYLDTTGTGDTRRAMIRPVDQFITTANPEGTYSFPAGTLLKNTANNTLWIKTTEDQAAFNGGSTGWMQINTLVSRTELADSTAAVRAASGIGLTTKTEGPVYVKAGDSALNIPDTLAVVYDTTTITIRTTSPNDSALTVNTDNISTVQRLIDSAAAIRADIAPPGSGVPGGSASEIQYRVDASTFGGGAGTSWDNTNSGLSINKDALGVTRNVASGLILSNSTAAAAGAQQISPSLRWRGFGWKTDATAESRPVDFIADILPVQGAANPTVTWRLASRINDGTVTDQFTVNSSGNATVVANMTAGSFTAGAANFINWNGRSLITSPANGTVRFTNAAQNSFTGLYLGTATSSFPYIKVNGALIDFRTGDDAAYTDINIAGRAYNESTWNGSNRAVSEDAVRDKIESLLLVQGTYTPTITNSTNVDATALAGTVYYQRIGNQVTVWGAVEIDVTSASTLTSIAISLPAGHTSALTNYSQLTGFIGSGSANTGVGAVVGDATNDRAQCDFTCGTELSSRAYSFRFSYEVL